MATLYRGLSGSRVEDTTDGIRYIDNVRIEGIAGASFEALSAAALNDVAMPARGSGLTSFSSMKLRTRTVTGAGCKQGGTKYATVTLVYEEVSSLLVAEPDDDGDGVVTIETVTEQVETGLDVNGDPIEVTFTGKSPATQPARVSYRKPRTTIRVERHEVSNPRTRQETYQGHTNSATWNGYGAGTVFCSSIVATSDDGGASYRVVYTFEVDPDGWQATVQWIDPATGQPPPGGDPSISDTGYATVTLYPEVAFSGLSITL